jgi:hypothetical protein
VLFELVEGAIREARAASAIVLTYDPDRYTGHHIGVINLRP